MDFRSPPQPIYLFGAFRLDATRLTLSVGANVVPTTPRVVSTLLYLVEHAGRTVTRDEMLRALWPGRLAEEANLNQAISAVRKLLASEQGCEEWIITMPGKGYRFTGEVAVQAVAVPALAPDRGKAEPAVPLPSLRDVGPRSARLQPAILAMVLGLVALGVAVVWLFATPAAHLPRDRTGVVVADLQNETGEPVFDHLIPRILQVDLAQSPFLQVWNDAKIAQTLALMERPSATPLTEPVAREVCSRNNGGAVIEPTVTHLGASYILTVTATDCLEGRSLYADKAVAASKDAVGSSLEQLSDRLRRYLGEDQASISHSEVPLTSVKTASFDALAAYSEGVWLHAHDHELEAITAFRHATELDPNFAMAYDGLYNPLYVTKQQELADAAATRAFALRGTVPDRDRLLISSHYHFFVDGDLAAARDDLKLLTGLYPRDARAWANLSNVENQLGDYVVAVDAGERALSLEPNTVASYSVLARALNHDDQIARAVKIDRMAMQKGVAGGDTRGQLIAETFELGQRRQADEIVYQSRGTPLERDAMLQAYDIYMESGQVHRADAALARAVELGRVSGAAIDQGSAAGEDIALGRLDKARAELSAVPPADRDGYYYLLAAAVEDPSTVNTGLAQALLNHPRDTLLNGFFAPMTRAMLLSRRGRPREAVAAFKIPNPLILHHIIAPYWLGKFQLAAGDSASAAQSFRTVLAHPGFSYSSPYDLARLELARALHRSGDITGSRQAYAAFLLAWREADADLPLLQAAKAEYRQLLISQKQRGV